MIPEATTGAMEPRRGGLPSSSADASDTFKVTVEPTGTMRSGALHSNVVTSRPPNANSNPTDAASPRTTSDRSSTNSSAASSHDHSAAGDRIANVSNGNPSAARSM